MPTSSAWRLLTATAAATLFALASSPATASWTTGTFPDHKTCYVRSGDGLQFEWDGATIDLLLDTVPSQHWFDDTIDVFYTHVYSVNLAIGSAHFHMDMRVVDYGTATDFGLVAEPGTTVVSILAPVDELLLQHLRAGARLDVSIGVGNPPLQYSLSGSSAAIDALLGCQLGAPA